LHRTVSIRPSVNDRATRSQGSPSLAGTAQRPCPTGQGMGDFGYGGALVGCGCGAFPQVEIQGLTGSSLSEAGDGRADTPSNTTGGGVDSGQRGLSGCARSQGTGPCATTGWALGMAAPWSGGGYLKNSTNDHPFSVGSARGAGGDGPGPGG
jgi:hypothetical protein